MNHLWGICPYCKRLREHPCGCHRRLPFHRRLFLRISAALDWLFSES